MKKKLPYIYFSYAISFVIIIIISFLYSEEFNELSKTNRAVIHSYEVKSKILKVRNFLLEAENSQRGFLLNGDKRLLIHFKQSQVNIYNELSQINELTKENSQQQKIISQLRKVISLRYQILYQPMYSIANGSASFFDSTRAKGDSLMQQFVSLSNQLDQIETYILDDQKSEAGLMQVAAALYLKLVLIISFCFQLASFLLIVNAFRSLKENEKILEKKIKEQDLSSLEMEQITFVASHDLQEPLRKIRTFSDKLVKQHYHELNTDGKLLLDKISHSSARMQELIQDLISYTHLTENEETKEQVDLNDCIHHACQSLNEEIQKKQANIKVQKLEFVTGYYQQLYLLFFNLLQNALNFSKPGQTLVIKISSSIEKIKNINETQRFLKVTITDNGLGFEQGYSEKIFRIFQQLQPGSEGKGIGLAICKRVMINHGGRITAKGEVGTGAEFNLFFPIE